MRFLACLLALSLLPPGRAAAQPIASARVLAMGGAATALPGDVWASANEASWAHARRRAVGVAAAQLYGLPELRAGAAALCLPFRRLRLGASLHALGFADFRSAALRLGLARRWPQRGDIAAGLAVALHHVRIAGHGRAAAPVVSAGLIVPTAYALSFGLRAENLLDASLVPGEALPRVMAFGAHYAATPSARVVLDVVKDVAHPLSVRGGVEIAPHRMLRLRAGAAHAPERFTAGIGLALAHADADVATFRHPVLGWSTTASLVLRW